MRTRADGRGLATVSATTAAIVNGEADLSAWSEEELRRGRRRAVDGSWSGKPPNLVPKAIHDELVRRKLSQAFDLLRDNVHRAVEVLAEIATDDEADPAIRVKAATEILDRGLGKPTERLAMDVRARLAPWQQVAARAIVGTDEQAERAIIEGEIVEDEPEILDDTIPDED